MEEQPKNPWGKVRDVVIYFGREMLPVVYQGDPEPWQLPLVTSVHCYLGENRLEQTN
jgi:hypothetical protein